MLDVRHFRLQPGDSFPRHWRSGLPDQFIGFLAPGHTAREIPPPLAPALRSSARTNRAVTAGTEIGAIVIPRSSWIGNRLPSLSGRVPWGSRLRSELSGCPRRDRCPCNVGEATSSSSPSLKQGGTEFVSSDGDILEKVALRGIRCVHSTGENQSTIAPVQRQPCSSTEDRSEERSHFDPSRPLPE